MILELNQSELAKRLKRLDEAIVALFEAIADAEPGDGWREVTSAWPCGTAPSQSLVEEVLELSPDERAKLRDAIEVDLAFESGFERSDFEFHFAALDAGIREVAKPLLLSLYKTFGKTGFDLGDGGRTNRPAWEDAFREANPGVRVCPACLDAELEERIRGRAAVDLDHYLPKSLYPPLAVHGLNMVPICKPCNGPAKSTADPLRNGRETVRLSEVWFPYVRSGIRELQVEFAVGDPTASVSFVGPPAARRRAEVHDRLFDVSSRWERSLKSVHEDICDDLQVRGVPPQRDPVKRELELLAHQNERAIQRTQRAFLTSRYCRWLIGNVEALDDLLAEL